MSDILIFPDRKSFRDWLDKNGTDSGGIWVLFGKKGGPATLSANDALEEALCYGWIDGLMQSIDNKSYKKYFARRTAKSNWSDKNKKLVQRLIEKELLTQQGLDAVEHAKKNGSWDNPTQVGISEEQVQTFKQLIQAYEPAYTNLLAMPPSVQRTYTRLYFDAKSDKTRLTRLEKILDRLNQNLKPM